MLICEQDDGLVIGHQCGYYKPRNIGKSVFKTLLDKIDSVFSANEIIQLLQDTTKLSFSLPYTVAYHYLPADTLLKIIDQSKDDDFILRFTNIDYMNDTTDGKYGHSEFINVIKSFFEVGEIQHSELLLELKNNLYQGFNELVKKNPCTRNESTNTLFMFEGELCNVYVCSLSLDPELLPLWKNYGGGFGESYAIGLNLHEISDICVCRIEYNNYSPEGRFLPAIIFEKIFDACKQDKIQKSDVNSLVKTIMEFSSAWSISRKEYVWAYENEIRLIKFLPIGTEPDGYTVRNGVFRPYIEVQMDKKRLSEVIVGPMVERYNAAKSIDEYLGNKGFGGGRDKLQVRCSALPVRF